MSIVFDRAITFYDQTRALDPAIMDKAMHILVQNTGLTNQSQVLEIGVGTGRIAIPMSEHVGRVYGVDLSLAMMGVLESKLAATPRPIRLSQADVTKLPFDAETFELAYGVHILHLVSGWQTAVAEAWRVLTPGGHLVFNFHRRHPETPNAQLRKHLGELLKSHGVSNKRPGAQSEQDIADELEKYDPAAKIVDVADWTGFDTPARVLGELDSQIHSETWMIPRPVMDQVMPQLRTWATAQYGDLDKPYEAAYSFRWLIAEKK